MSSVETLNRILLHINSIETMLEAVQEIFEQNVTVAGNLISNVQESLINILGYLEPNNKIAIAMANDLSNIEDFPEAVEQYEQLAANLKNVINDILSADELTPKNEVLESNATPNNEILETFNNAN